MTVWRYRAVPLADPVHGRVQAGERSGDSAAEVRESLRRVDLQVIDLREVRRRPRALRPAEEEGARGFGASWDDCRQRVRAFVDQSLRTRRRAARAETLDSLSTMLASGISLAQALGVLLESEGVQGALRRRLAPSARAQLLSGLRTAVQSGQGLAEAAADHGDWFDAVDQAILDAGERAGSLPEVLASLAERDEKASALAHKLLGALAYPALVLAVGLGVVVFLSNRTLPEFASVLEEASLEVPALTRWVMAVGQALVQPVTLALVALAGVGGIGFWVLRRDEAAFGEEGSAAAIRSAGSSSPAAAQTRGASRGAPRLVREVALAPFAQRLADLSRNGIPLLQGLRVLLPTIGQRTLRWQIRRAIARVEGGASLSEALQAEPWFDGEFCQLIEVGEKAGEMDRMLGRLASRYERRSARLVERVTALLEPLLIVVLAAVVGVVAFAAVLPMIRMQELL